MLSVALSLVKKRRRRRWKSGSRSCLRRGRGRMGLLLRFGGWVLRLRLALSRAVLMLGRVGTRWVLRRVVLVIV